MAWNEIKTSDTSDQSIKLKMKFLIDSNLGVGTKEFMIQHGYNTIFANDVGLQGKSDENVYQYAKKHKRILLTHDYDFRCDRKFPFCNDTAIVMLPGGDGNQNVLIRALDTVVHHIAPFRNIFLGSKIEINECSKLTIKELQSQAFG